MIWPYFNVGIRFSNYTSTKRHFSTLQSPNSMLFGVFDGHAGASCGKVVAKRLLHYVAAGLLSIDDLRSHLSGNSH